MAQQNSINLSTIKDAAFLANKSYKTANGEPDEKSKIFGVDTNGFS